MVISNRGDLPFLLCLYIYVRIDKLMNRWIGWTDNAKMNLEEHEIEIY